MTIKLHEHVKYIDHAYIGGATDSIISEVICIDVVSIIKVVMVVFIVGGAGHPEISSGRKPGFRG